MTTEVLSYTISAGTTVRAPRGRLFFIKTAANPVSITASGRPGAPIKFSNVTAGLKYGPVDESEHWEYLEITSATTQTVELIIGDDDVEVAGTVSIAGTVTVSDANSTVSTLADVTLAATTLGQAVAAGIRKSVTITALSTNAGSVRIGDTFASATRGLELQPGQSITTTANNQIVWYNPNAVSSSISLWIET